MKAFVIDRYGTPDVLELRDVATPTPKADQVLVRVLAASINDWDWGLLRGDPVNRVLSGLVRPRVHILGCDIAGRVEAVGREVEALRPGDEVYGDLCMSGFGAFAEFVCAPEAGLARKPAGMTFEQAAAIPQAGMLAVQGLIDVGRIQSGQKVLLNGAGGGVGTFALQIAKLHDVEVTAVDKPGKLDMLRALGADHVIDYLEEDFTAGGERYDLILDARTNRSPFAYARALNRNGIYVTVGGSIPRLLETLVLSPLIARLYRKHLRIVSSETEQRPRLHERVVRSRQTATGDRRAIQADRSTGSLRLFGTGDHRGKIIVTMA